MDKMKILAKKKKRLLKKVPKGNSRVEKYNNSVEKVTNSTKIDAIWQKKKSANLKTVHFKSLSEGRKE